MKRIIALLLVLLLLTGCAAETVTTGASDTTTSAPASGSTASDNGIDPTDPAETTVPEDPTNPTNPTDPTTAPTDPADPTTAPTDPTAAPTDPTDPTTAPTDPTEPPEPTIPYPACGGHDSDPYADVDVEAFYANYSVSCCYTDSQYRTQHYLMSGNIEVPDKDVTFAEAQPMLGSQYVRNTDSVYLDDGNTYVVFDCYGEVAMYIYRGGAYITLEEVAAYMFAFGGSNDSIPANYSANKKTKPANSEWGEYLRVNHSKFSGDTDKYPNEPEMPNITGCGGSLQYYEMDIGTTGCGNNPGLYNNGTYINRGAARLIYGRCDLNNDGVFGTDEVFAFYTCNHYEDFREYLNYYGGWGEIFGNQTGGGISKPTAYPETAYAAFSECNAITVEVVRADGSTKTVYCMTDEAYLDKVLIAQGLIEQDNIVSGYFDTVLGETASWQADQAYWAFYVDGEYAMLGICETPVEDGKCYRLVYTVSDF